MLDISALAESTALIIREVTDPLLARIDALEQQLAAKDGEIEARLASVAEAERRLNERIAAIRDGVDGKDGRDGIDGKDGADGAPGPAGKDGADGRDGVDGKDGAPGPEGPPGRDGVDGKDGKDGIGVDDIDVKIIDEETYSISFLRGDTLETFELPIVHGKDGKDGADGEAGPEGPPGKDGRDGVDGKDGEPGRDGIDGKDGAPGKLAAVRAWEDRVHYEGDLVFRGGSTWQALRDTAKEPPHEDWQPVALAGAAGRSPRVRETWNADAEYLALDIVALNGGSFIARCDDPGPCPGEGWQLLTSVGKRGERGERGPAGERGQQGMAGPAIMSASIDDNGLLTIISADGSRVECDFYPLLSKIDRA